MVGFQFPPIDLYAVFAPGHPTLPQSRLFLDFLLKAFASLELRRQG
jgi:hypothetical protein